MRHTAAMGHIPWARLAHARRRGLRAAVSLGLASVLGCAELDPALMDGLLKGLGAPLSLDERKVDMGLREALRVGTQRAVLTVSRQDGFWADPRIRVPLPEKLEPMTRALRGVGLGRQVEAFELSMNRAAESASGEAVEVFWQAIRQMTVADAFGILNGGESSATDYLRTSASADLSARFSPIVEQKMRDVGLYRIYRELDATYQALPFAPPLSFDLGDYVTQGAVDGLFTVLAREEVRIRQDPAARTTELLREVFGR